jgi:uncharacterized protein YqeY
MLFGLAKQHFAFRKLSLVNYMGIMSIKERIEADLKQALLAGNKTLVTTLRGLKSAILYVEVAEGKRDKGLDDQEVVSTLRKEAKKRKESAELFKQGGRAEKAQAETEELHVIEAYLPPELDEEDLLQFVDQAIQDVSAKTMQEMGKVISRVKELTKGQVDGGRIAQKVKERLGK